MKQRSKVVAYPGLPVIFAEGFRDAKNRVSMHSHASLAVTDIHETAKTENVSELAPSGVSFTIDGSKPHDARGLAAYKVIEDMLAYATDRTGVEVSSSNHNILTGSSDSGAAALVMGLDDVLELGLPIPRLVELARPVSETAYRSIVGGLSQCLVDERGGMKVSQLRKASFFQDMEIYAVPFDGPRRFSADDLHARVVHHKHYGHRSTEVNDRLIKLQKILVRGDLTLFMALMEAEAKTVHTMFSEQGMDVITPEMKAVIDLVGKLRESAVQAYWNVAGGSHVYVFTLKDYVKDVTHELKSHDFKYRHYKVADGAKAVP